MKSSNRNAGRCGVIGCDAVGCSVRKRMRVKMPVLLLMLVFVLVMLAGCGKDEPVLPERPGIDLVSSQPQSAVTAFYGATDSDMLVPLSFAINSSRDTMWIALEKLLAGPPDSFVEPVVPQGLKLKDLYYAGGVINIGLTGDARISADDIDIQAIAVTANVELQKQDNSTASVMISYNDKELLTEPYEVKPFNVVGDFESSGDYVYYSDAQAMYVVPVCLAVVSDTTDEAHIAALLEKWAAGPPGNIGLYGVMPSGVKLLGVELADRALTVNFSEELLQMGGTAQEQVFFNSLLATLRSCPVDTVQIVVNGEVAPSLSHGTDISLPIKVSHDFADINRVVQ